MNILYFTPILLANLCLGANVSQRRKPALKLNIAEATTQSQQDASKRHRSPPTVNDAVKMKASETLRAMIECNEARWFLGAPFEANATRLHEFALAAISKGVDKVALEFAQIRKQPSATADGKPLTTDAHNAHPKLNRYGFVPCVDQTRVLLKIPASSKRNDYIHANRVALRDRRTMLLTQAPLSGTAGDFWQMVWQEGVTSIVMLCNSLDTACHPHYWPFAVNEELTFANFRLQNVVVTPDDGRALLTQLRVNYAEGRAVESRMLRHIRTEAWPDHSVPDDPLLPLHLLRMVAEDASIVVHCSAGVGRTGTLVLIELVLEALASGASIDVAHLLLKLREARHIAVQTPIQYVFVHRVLLVFAMLKKAVTLDEVLPFEEQYQSYLSMV